MRWIDKPRKKSSREIVLEYIKFLKIMGYYHVLVKAMYDLAKLRGNYVPLYKNHIVKNYPIEALLHKENMIRFLEVRIINITVFNKSACERVFTYDFLTFFAHQKCMDIKELLWSYFKEKHIANCIIIADDG